MIESPVFSIDCVINKEAEIVGNLPVLISVPHDGRRTTIGHQYICPLPGGIPADKNVRFLARDICSRVKDSTTATPSLVIDEIQRSRRWQHPHFSMIMCIIESLNYQKNLKMLHQSLRFSLICMDL